MTLKMVKTSEIESESLNNEQIQSCIARYLRIDGVGMPTASHEIDTVVYMMLNAIYPYQYPLLLNDLLGWHKALFPNGYSGL